MASIPEKASLEAGLTALERGDYREAITQFESVCTLKLNETFVERAQIGLVKAYSQIGEIEKAIALGETLSQSPNLQTKNWADKTLAKLRDLATPRSRERQNNPPQESRPLPTAPTAAAIVKSPISKNDNTYKWRQAHRASRWGPLPVGVGLASNIRLLWVGQGLTAIALVWWIGFLLKTAEPLFTKILDPLPLLRPILWWRNPTQVVLISLILLLIVSPWLIEAILKYFHNLQPLTIETLSDRSPDAAKILQRFCRQRRLKVPKLGILPTRIPLALTYGNLPQTARIIVSQGLLEQLADDEIATIYATQLGQIVHWDFAVMSLGVLILQIPYIIYWQITKWGDHFSTRIEKPILASLFLSLATLIGNLSYNIYWLLRLPLLWLSRQRLFYSDAEAVAITGNPNALTRALLKIAIGIVDDIHKNQSLNGLLESFQLLIPVEYRQAIALCHRQPDTNFESLLPTDINNPYRQWLTLGSSHPLMGNRLQRLAHYARYWRLPTELDLPTLEPSKPKNKFLWQTQIKNALQTIKSLLLNNHKHLPLVQTALIYSTVFGLGLRLTLWIIGIIAYFTYLGQLVWLSQDQNGDLIIACLAISFGITVLVKINAYFPDIKTATKTERHLPEMLANPTAFPTDSKTIRLEGKLLGRRGISNVLGQDLILQTTTGLVKLHYLSPLGPLGNIWPSMTRPSDFIGQSVKITGWFRRGDTAWIDLETLSSRSKVTCRSYHPVWIAIIALVIATWGAYLTWQT